MRSRLRISHDFRANRLALILQAMGLSAGARLLALLLPRGQAELVSEPLAKMVHSLGGAMTKVPVLHGVAIYPDVLVFFPTTDGVETQCQTGEAEDGSAFAKEGPVTNGETLQSLRITFDEARGEVSAIAVAGGKGTRFSASLPRHPDRADIASAIRLIAQWVDEGGKTL